MELVGRRLMVVGGHGGRGEGPHAPEEMAEVYDLSAWWMVSGPLKARYLHATCASSGKVLVLGGKDGEETTLSSVEAYDVDTSRWQELCDLRVARHSAAASALGGYVCVMGGFDGFCALDAVEIMDLQGGKPFEMGPPLSSGRGKLAAACLGRSIFLLGGMDSGYRCLAEAERLTWPMCSWCPLAPLRQARSDCAATAARGAVLVAGGAHGFTTLATVERYDPLLGTWEPLPELQLLRRSCACGALAGAVYVLGGAAYGGKATAAVEVRDGRLAEAAVRLRRRHLCRLRALSGARRSKAACSERFSPAVSRDFMVFRWCSTASSCLFGCFCKSFRSFVAPETAQVVANVAVSPSSQGPSALRPTAAAQAPGRAFEAKTFSHSTPLSCSKSLLSHGASTAG